MKLRSTFKYVSLFLVFKYLEKAFAGKVKFQSVIIEKVFLQTLLNNEQFISLFFSTVYDNRLLAKDKISLAAHILNEKSNGQMIKHSLEVMGEDNVLDNEKNYSSYEIKKEELLQLLESGGDEVFYFIFRPVTYALDVAYVSYRIIAADRNKIGLSERHGDYAYTATMNPSPPASSSFEMES